MTDLERQEMREEATRKNDHPTKPTPMLVNPRGVLALLDENERLRSGLLEASADLLLASGDPLEEKTVWRGDPKDLGAPECGAIGERWACVKPVGHGGLHVYEKRCLIGWIPEVVGNANTAASEQQTRGAPAVKAFDRDSCGGLIVNGIPGSDGAVLTCQRCWPDMVQEKRCDHCFDPLPRWDYAVDAKGDPFCRECEAGLKAASARRSRP